MRIARLQKSAVVLSILAFIVSAAFLLYSCVKARHVEAELRGLQSDDQW
jgi:hypothetical protein